MPELKALARERRLRGYPRLRKAELIELIRNNQRPLQSWEPSIPQRAPLGGPPQQIRPPPGQAWEPQTTTQPKLEEAPLTERQLKHRRNKDSKLAKEFKRLESDIDNLKSQMDALKDRISKASKSTNARFKR